MANTRSVLNENGVFLPLLWWAAEAAVVVECSADARNSLAHLQWRSTNGHGRGEESGKSGESELHDEMWILMKSCLKVFEQMKSK